MFLGWFNPKYTDFDLFSWVIFVNRNSYIVNKIKPDFIDRLYLGFAKQATNIKCIVGIKHPLI